MKCQLVRGAGTVGALLLVLGLSPWGPAAARIPGLGPSAQALVSPCLEDPPEDAPPAQEGAKTAVGWAVGLNSGGYGTILHTTDGGQAWVRQGTPDEMGGGDLSGAAAVDAQEAWVAGNVGEDGLLLHTRDGGQTWSAEGDAGDLGGNGLVSVSAVDARTAWAVGANGLILYTTDGGNHWVRQGAGQVPGVSLQGVYAADSSHAWAVGAAEEGNDYGTIVHTADAGNTWSKVPYQVTHTPHTNVYHLITVHGANANEVWAVGHDQIIHVSVTAGGAQAVDQTQPFGDYDINGVFAVSRRALWAVADNSTIWRSLNGGKEWTKRNPQGAGYVLRVWALDKKHAWVTTGDYSGHGTILYTANGGKNWTSQSIPADPQMWGISFVK